MKNNFYQRFQQASYKKTNNEGTPRADHKSPLNCLNDRSPLSVDKWIWKALILNELLSRHDFIQHINYNKTYVAVKRANIGKPTSQQLTSCVDCYMKIRLVLINMV